MAPSTLSPQPMQEIHDGENIIRRNPHPDFHSVEASRADWDSNKQWHWTKTNKPTWKYASGSSCRSSAEHISIDPSAPGRDPRLNYKLLISGVVPRPIGFLSTASLDGKSTNLAPYSYTQLVSHDPPLFTVSFTAFTGSSYAVKDTLRNLLETKECVINMVSEDFVEAMNSTAMDLPYGQSEWSVSGLTPAPTEVVKPKRIKESVFAIEGKLVSSQEFESRSTPGKIVSVLAIIEGVRFWAREDALNPEQSLIDPAILRPVARLGGITYARITEGFEIPRPILSHEVRNGKLDEQLVRPKIAGQ